MTAPARTRRPLRVPTVLYAHPFEYLVGVAFLILGARALVLGVTSPSVDQLPDLPLLLYRVASTMGGAGIVAGLVTRAYPIGRAIERASCYLLASSLAAFAVLVITNQQADGFGVAALTVAIAGACLLRALAIRKTERVILSTLRTANRLPAVELRRLVDGRPPEEPRP